MSKKKSPIPAQEKPKPPGTVSDQAKRALQQMGRNANGGKSDGET